MKKYGVNLANDVKMWELIRYNKVSKEWERLGIYAKDEKEAYRLANLYEENDIYDYLDWKEEKQ